MGDGRDGRNTRGRGRKREGERGGRHFFMKRVFAFLYCKLIFNNIIYDATDLLLIDSKPIDFISNQQTNLIIKIKNIIMKININ